MPFVTHTIVREFLDYNLKTGRLKWRSRSRDWFKTDAAWKTWNTRYAGRPFGRQAKDKRCEGAVLGHLYLRSRVIFLWVTGRWPNPEVDHKNRDYHDDRWLNLEEATSQSNKRNQSLGRRNTSGRIGVTKTIYGTYSADIRGNNKKNIHLGTFKTLAEAVAARVKAERKLGYSKGHGLPKASYKPQP